MTTAQLVLPANLAYTLRTKIKGIAHYYVAQKYWTVAPNHATIFLDYDMACEELRVVRMLYPDMLGTEYDVVSLHGALTKSPA